MGTKAPKDFIVNNTDILAVALNNAQQNAQKLHDFEYSKALVDIEVDLLVGTDLSTAVLHGTSTPASVKSVLGVALNTEKGLLRPMEFIGRVNFAERVFEQYRGGHQYGNRYPADGDHGWFNDRVVYQMNETLYCHPASVTAGQVVKLTLEASLWLDAYSTGAEVVGFNVSSPMNGVYSFIGVYNGQNFYQKMGLGFVWFDGSVWRLSASQTDVNYWSCATASGIYTPVGTSVGNYLINVESMASTNDFLVKYGGGWLMWEAINEVNMMSKNFVTRQEGNIGTKEIMQKRDEEWRKLLMWDSFLIEGGRTPTLR